MLPTDAKWIIWLNLRRATRISVSSCPFHANLGSIIIYWVDAKLKEVESLAFTFEEQTFPLNHLTQVRSTPLQIYRPKFWKKLKQHLFNSMRDVFYIVEDTPGIISRPI